MIVVDKRPRTHWPIRRKSGVRTFGVLMGHAISLIAVRADTRKRVEGGVFIWRSAADAIEASQTVRGCRYWP